MARNPARPRNTLRPGSGARPGERFSIIGFFGEVWVELRRVNWPSRQEATRLTVLVLVVSGVMGLFLGAADWLFSRLIQWLANL